MFGEFKRSALLISRGGGVYLSRLGCWWMEEVELEVESWERREIQKKSERISSVRVSIQLTEKFLQMTKWFCGVLIGAFVAVVRKSVRERREEKEEDKSSCEFCSQEHILNGWLTHLLSEFWFNILLRKPWSTWFSFLIVHFWMQLVQ